MKYFLYFFVVLFLFNLNSHAEFVCASTTTRANIAADEDDSCTTDAEVLTVTLTKGEFIMLLDPIPNMEIQQVLHGYLRLGISLVILVVEAL